jgi:hypothetical protein
MDAQMLALMLGMIAVLVFFATVLTAVLSAIYRAVRAGVGLPKRSFAIVGTLVPILMLIDGLYLSWKMRGVVTDMFGPPGPWLLMLRYRLGWLASG